MSSPSVPHFEEPGRVNPKTSQDLMPEAAYSSALDHLVLTCVDIAFVHHDQILLARRNRYPRKSWWIIGGRMVAGENPLETAQRKAFEEARLQHLNPARFQFIGVYSTSFAFREQAPVQNGSHSVNLTYCIRLTDPERHCLHLTAAEYDPDYRWVNLDHVGQLVRQDSPLDQALLKITHDIQRLVVGQ